MTRLLVLIGSGETTPTMVETHKRILASVGDGRPAVLVDTPYGFQRNADEVTDRSLAYFARNVGRRVDAVDLRRVQGRPPAQVEAAVASVAEAGWVFAGPGSPTYLRRQWALTRLPQVLANRLERPGATVFASAAVCSIGRRTLPVYEIYKVGEDPRWEDGFALTDRLGWRCVVIPHFDNAEGGTHDTRYCYLGEARLRVLETQLPDDTWVLGIDEHTALVVDLDAGSATVMGRGAVTVRDRDRQRVVAAGTTVAIEELDAHAGTAGTAGNTGATLAPSSGAGTDPAPASADATPMLDELARHRDAATAAMDARDTVAAADAILAFAETLRAWSADTQQSDELDRGRTGLERLVVALARLAQRGVHSRAEVVEPFVMSLLAERDHAREQRDYDAADRIRDALIAARIEVRDTPDGVQWQDRQP